MSLGGVHTKALDTHRDAWYLSLSKSLSDRYDRIDYIVCTRLLRFSKGKESTMIGANYCLHVGMKPSHNLSKRSESEKAPDSLKSGESINITLQRIKRVRAPNALKKK